VLNYLKNLVKRGENNNKTLLELAGTISKKDIKLMKKCLKKDVKILILIRGKSLLDTNILVALFNKDKSILDKLTKGTDISTVLKICIIFVPFLFLL
jgi:hypothetical protein